MQILNNNYFMKKLLFLLTVGLFVAGSVSAQTYYYGPRRVHRRPPQQQDGFYKVKVGLTGSLNLANTVDAYNSYNSTSTIAAWSAGLYFDVPIVYPLSFEPEVMYSQKGFAATLTDGTQFTSRANFIDVPLLAKFHVVPGFNFLIGPQLSFPLSTTNTYSDGTTDHYVYGTNGTLVDGVIGVSFDINRSVELRARYTLDLSSNYDSDNQDYRNQVWQIGLGFTFQ
jgi:hypothetical protein